MTFLQDAYGQLVTEVVFTKYYGGPISSVFSPEQMEKQEDDEGFDEALVGDRYNECS